MPNIFVTIVLVLAAVFIFIFLLTRKNLEKEVMKRFSRDEIVGASTGANFMGVESQGGRQLRGNGALVLTQEKLWFMRVFPAKEYSIPLDAVEQVSLPRSFAGKTKGVRLLCVRYSTGVRGQDQMAWAVKNPEGWKEAIEKAKAEAS